MATHFPQPHKNTHQKLQRDVDVILKDIMHLWADLSEQQSDEESGDSNHLNVDLVLDRGYTVKKSPEKSAQLMNTKQKMYRSAGAVQRVHMVERIAVSSLIYNPTKTRKKRKNKFQKIVGRIVDILMF